MKSAVLLLAAMLVAQPYGPASAQTSTSAPLTVNVYAIGMLRDMLYVLGTPDSATTLLAIFPLPQAGGSVATQSGLKVMHKIAGQPIQMIRRISVEAENLVLIGDDTRYVLTHGRWAIADNPDVALFKYNSGSGDPVGVPFIKFWVPLYMVQEHIVSLPADGRPLRRFLVWNSRISSNSTSAPFQSSGIYELAGNGYKFYQLPQPTYDLFKRYRPRRVEDGYTEDIAKLNTEIGPFQLEDRRIWFGLRFYDGEGHTGVGGVGYFDPQKGTYQISYLKEIADWSASAILVEPNSVWMGLARYGEGTLIPGGIVSYDRTSKKIVRHEIPRLINVIRRVGDRLYVGTVSGISVMAAGTWEHLQFERDLGGNYLLRSAPR